MIDIIGGRDGPCKLHLLSSRDAMEGRAVRVRLLGCKCGTCQHLKLGQERERPWNPNPCKVLEVVRGAAGCYHASIKGVLLSYVRLGYQVCPVRYEIVL